MKKLQPDETELVAGRFHEDYPGLKFDESERLFQLVNRKFDVFEDIRDRINWLTNEVLVLVGIEKVGGWEKLYRDPGDGRYWLLTYPFGELQGGGPPSLICKPLSEAEIGSNFFTPDEWDEHMEEFMRERGIRYVSRDKPLDGKSG